MVSFHTLGKTARVAMLEKVDGVGDQLVVKVRNRCSLEIEDESRLERVLLWWLATRRLPEQLAGALQHKDDVSFVIQESILLFFTILLLLRLLWSRDVLTQADDDERVSVSVLSSEVDEVVGPERVLLEVPWGDAITTHG